MIIKDDTVPEKKIILATKEAVVRAFQYMGMKVSLSDKNQITIYGDVKKIMKSIDKQNSELLIEKEIEYWVSERSIYRLAIFFGIGVIAINMLNHTEINIFAILMGLYGICYAFICESKLKKLLSKHHG